MNVTACRLQASAVRPGDFPRDGFPEIAFMGRSNVGKSSLINALLGVKGLARTSKAPGRTQAIHFYRINERLYFVDLPGYGYAKVPRELRRSWQALVEAYLQGPSRPDLAVMLVDARHDPGELDAELLDWLRSRRIAHAVVLTKADKLSGNERAVAVRRAAGWLAAGAAGGAESGRGAAGGATEGPGVIAVSAATRDGLRDLWRVIDSTLGLRRDAGREDMDPRNQRPRNDRPGGASPPGRITSRATGGLPARKARGNPYRGGRNTL